MNIAIIGGDARMGALAEKLAGGGDRVICSLLDNYDFSVYCLETDTPAEAIKTADTVILPLPLTKDGVNLFTPLSENSITLADILDSAKEGEVVLVGKAPPEFISLLEAKKVRAVDYFNSEELTVLNAALTAEGAIATAINNTDTALLDSKILIVGAGRVGKLCAERFRSLHAAVTVSARKKSDIATLRAYGYSAIKTENIKDTIGEYDIVINTVPSVVIKEQELDNSKEDCLFIELASSPYGIDTRAAENKKRRVIRASALPGKTAPKTAAEILARTILAIIDELY